MKSANLISSLIVAGLFSLFPAGCWAYEINPCLRILVYKKYYLDSEAIRFCNLCERADLLADIDNGALVKGSVHEHITNFTVDEYRGRGFLVRKSESPSSKRNQEVSYNFMAEHKWSKSPEAREHKTYAIIFGSWWNDDPLMYTWGQGGDFKNGLFSLKDQFDSKTKKYTGGVAGCWLEGKDHLGWNSHYGKLQHLHFMSNQSSRVSDSDRLDETTRLALVWIKFAYGVAIGERPAKSALTKRDEEALSLPSVALNYCLSNAENAKVRTLFARVQSHGEEERDLRTPDVALGSIFHIIQDSFSPAHTCRKEQVVSGQHYAVLSGVYNFNEQLEEPFGKIEHGVNDRYPGWLLTYAQNGEHVYANDPIVVGVWMINAVDSGVDWDKVEAYLRSTIFRKQDGSGSDQSTCIGRRSVSEPI